MSVYLHFSEIHTVSSLNSNTEYGYLPHSLHNFNSISNREPKKGALNVVWFLTSYAITLLRSTPDYAKEVHENLAFLFLLRHCVV